MVFWEFFSDFKKGKKPIMSYVAIQDLLAKTNSLYTLVVLASKRAAELNAGAPRLVDNDEEDKITSIALEEILQNRVKLQQHN